MRWKGTATLLLCTAMLFACNPIPTDQCGAYEDLNQPGQVQHLGLGDSIFHMNERRNVGGGVTLTECNSALNFTALKSGQYVKTNAVGGQPVSHQCRPECLALGPGRPHPTVPLSSDLHGAVP